MQQQQFIDLQDQLSVTYRHRLDDHPNKLAKSLLQGPAPNRRLKRCYPADLATRF